MDNLAGDRLATEKIAQELAAAGIDAVPCTEPLGEVRALLTGRLGPFTFERAWVYWRVHGPVPLAVANAMYADPVGREAVRVAGNCGRPPPAPPWVKTHRTTDGTAYPIVPSYDVDSAAGLRLFVDSVRGAGIVDNPAELTTWNDEDTQAVVNWFATHRRGEVSSMGKLMLESAVVRAGVNQDDPRIVEIVQRCRAAQAAKERVAA